MIVVRGLVDVLFLLFLVAGFTLVFAILLAGVVAAQQGCEAEQARRRG
jgi:hypothetical protein